MRHVNDHLSYKTYVANFFKFLPCKRYAMTLTSLTSNKWRFFASKALRDKRNLNNINIYACGGSCIFDIFDTLTVPMFFLRKKYFFVDFLGKGKILP